MFETLRDTLRALRTGGIHPDERRGVIAQMRDTLVQARVGITDLRAALETTRSRLAAERRELETVRRRKGLAAGINDTETVTIATRYEEQHLQRATVLEQKLVVQQAELDMAEQEMVEMTAELKQAAAGVGSGATRSLDSSMAPDVAGDAATLHDELESLARARRRASSEAEAEEKLAALKRRMEK
jgi:multidrug resistance efflux pump